MRVKLKACLCFEYNTCDEVNNRSEQHLLIAEIFFQFHHLKNLCWKGCSSSLSPPGGWSTSLRLLHQSMQRCPLVVVVVRAAAAVASLTRDQGRRRGSKSASALFLSILFSVSVSLSVSLSLSVCLTLSLSSCEMSQFILINQSINQSLL